ncbi:hypothetical protein U9M48_004578 [Paspalum notatum var. saurae]|uniref:F-box domain-containing protein n=1 Tax=Paspalum notatum var. saurae TaxID=547442 RepID=A0AAQ3SLD9_PASNO
MARKRKISQKQRRFPTFRATVSLGALIPLFSIGIRRKIKGTLTAADGAAAACDGGMADEEAPPRPTASGADRLSALPDGVREHVLSFLPAHEAVRTTVLARSWRDLWRRSPALRITGWGTVAKFPQFVDRLLRLHRSACFHPGGGGGGDPCAAAPAPLDACHFDFDKSDFHGELDTIADEARVNEWIQSALRCRVRVLRFCYARDCEPLDLPDLSLAASMHLTRLELGGVAIFHNLNLSGCPALTDLKMDDCFFFAQEILAPSLKHLTMSSGDFFYDHRVRIRLPSLVSLKLIKCHGWTPFLARMPLLETAVVTHSHDFDDTCSLMSVDGCGDGLCRGCRDYVSHPDRKSCLLLSGLSEATHLELSAPREMVVYIRDLKFAHTFGKLKTLILADWFVAAGLSALIWFLDHSPILEKLTLQISEVHKNTITTEGSCELPASPVASSRLNIVEIKCPEVDGIVIEILKILAASGVPLEKVNIQRSVTGSDCHHIIIFNYQSYGESTVLILNALVSAQSRGKEIQAIYGSIIF